MITTETVPIELTLQALLDKWLPDHHKDELRVAAVGSDAPERLEWFYAHLRRCRQLCNGRLVIEEHAMEGRHDCTRA
jgi:hypothetical protein